MTDPTLKLTWRHLDPSPSLAALVDDEVAQLGRLFHEPVGIDVTIARGARFGAPVCQVRVVLEAPGTVLVADRVPASEDEADAYAEVREAFAHLRRQLTRHLQRKSPRAEARIARY